MKRRRGAGHPFVQRFKRGRREAWRAVTWQEKDSYTVDGDARVFDDPVDAIHLAIERGTFARRTSDDAKLNYYMPAETE